MNTLHFRYAVEIEKTRSITQAAENLFMAQPNLSKAIKELENTLGITIFRRTSKGVIPTEQGLRFLSYAKQVLIQLDNMEAIRSPEASGRSRLRVCAPRTGYISRAFSAFAAQLSASERSELQFTETNAVTAIASVRELGSDLGVIRFRLDHERYFMDYLAEKSLDSQILWDFETVAVMSEKHPLAHRDELSYSELSSCSAEIVLGDETVPYLNSVPSMKGGKRIIDLGSRASILETLAAVSDSFFLTSPMPTDELSRSGLVQRQCRFDGNSFRDLLIYTSEHSFSETEIALVNIIYTERNKSAYR